MATTDGTEPSSGEVSSASAVDIMPITNSLSLRPGSVLRGTTNRHKKVKVNLSAKDHLELRSILVQGSPQKFTKLVKQSAQLKTHGLRNGDVALDGETISELVLRAIDPEWMKHESWKWAERGAHFHDNEEHKV